MKKEKRRSRFSHDARILNVINFISGNSNPAVVPFGQVQCAIFHHKIVLYQVVEKGLPFVVD